MTTTETPALEALSPPEIETLWAEALEPARKAEARLAETKRKRRRYAERGYPIPEYLEAEEQKRYEAFQIALEPAEPFEAEWKRRGGWARYFLVSGGHLHKRTCHTLTPGRTLVGMIPEAAGMTAAEVVERFSYTACTHCFPEAPVEAKRTPAEEGFCEFSGTYVPAERLPEGWHLYAVAPAVRCACGWSGAVTASGKYRKHRKPEGS